MYDNERELEKLENDRELYRSQELEDIRKILSMPEGLRFFKRMMEDGRIFTTTFTGNSQTFFLEGHRNLALKYFSDIVESCPDKVALIIKTNEVNNE